MQKKDYETGIKEYTKLANDGSVASEGKLCSHYAKLINTIERDESDEKNFRHWCINAANHGDFLTQKLLGALFSVGRGFERNNNQAIYWLGLAQKQAPTDVDIINMLIFLNRSFLSIPNSGNRVFSQSYSVYAGNLSLNTPVIYIVTSKPKRGLIVFASDVDYYKKKKLGTSNKCYPVVEGELEAYRQAAQGTAEALGAEGEKLARLQKAGLIVRSTLSLRQNKFVHSLQALDTFLTASGDAPLFHCW